MASRDNILQRIAARTEELLSGSRTSIGRLTDRAGDVVDRLCETAQGVMDAPAGAAENAAGIQQRASAFEPGKWYRTMLDMLIEYVDIFGQGS